MLTACGGGSGGETATTSPPVVVDENPPPVTPPTDLIYQEPNDVARFLTQATFGPSKAEIEALTDESVSQWFINQLALQPSYLQPVLTEMSQLSNIEDGKSYLEIEATTIGFWRNAILANDQLRQRVAFALSEILVVSNGGGDVLTDVPSAVAYYQDLLIEHAFGNYRELLEAVTYSPAMGYYLTYIGSEKANPETGRMPDENYARELLQLFTIGVVELNQDGSVQLDSQGDPIETYNNTDITGLAKVFTGLNINEQAIERSRDEAFAMPMQTFSESHSSAEKTFLELTIAENTGAQESINQALDHIFAHNNVAPFIGEQLIQRLVMSNPSADYIKRVANIFDVGSYTLPNGEVVGEGRRGDLAATIAAILFDDEARTIQGEQGGKLREPILRFSHWARAFNVTEVTPEFQIMLWDSGKASRLAQHPYRSPSVFNFFRPGYMALGTLTGENQLKAPELQIVNASSTAGYSNFMTYFIYSRSQNIDLERVAQFLEQEQVNLEASDAANSFVADYQYAQSLVGQPQQLLDYLDLLLTYGTLSQSTREHIVNTIAPLPSATPTQQLQKLQLAILLVMTSPDYLIQQ